MASTADATVPSGSRATSTSTPNPNTVDDLDPAAFLKSVRELSEKREREDVERYRKLEEEVERSRAQRAARRAERERSLSPEKSSTPLHSAPRHLRTPSRASRVESPIPAAAPSSVSQSPPPAAAPMSHHPLPPPPDSPTKDIPEFAGFGSMKKKSTPAATPPMPSAELFDNNHKSPPSATSLARSGTLSWQQRPEFKTSSRPTSFAPPSTSSHSRDPSTDRPEPSRDQIAASLGSRDPSWFKQTADRGIGSPAYKKSNDETTATPGEIIRRGLPGMSRDGPRERQRTRSPVARTLAESPSINSTRDVGFASGRFSPSKATTSTSSRPDLRSLIAEDEAQNQVSPMVETTEQHKKDRAYVMSPSQSNLTDPSDRPSSPTKGFGGFVHSAALKRSASMTKRWSAQPSGASRPGSALSHVSGIGGLQGSHSMPKLEPSIIDHQDSSERMGRSNSRNHAGLTVTTGQADESGFVKPALPYHSRSRSVASPYAINSDIPASSPTHQKRFSPTKSSWIESALTRPESPKPLAPAKNTQPAWMANIAKAKAEKASGDNTPRFGTPKTGDDERNRSRSASPTKSPFGRSLLKRSETRDLAAVPPSSTPPPRATPTSSISKPAEYFDGSPLPSRQQSDPALRQTPEDDSKPEESHRVAEPVKPIHTRPDSSHPTPQPAISKPKPETPPKPNMDFRSNLRARAPTESKPEQEPEFLSKFGNLKRTKTEKYVAPDFLKREITRGKAELAKTDGPVKTARRDELKESLLAKKEEMKRAKEEGRDLPGQAHERKNSNAPITPSKPEALQKRELMGRPTANTKAQTNGGISEPYTSQLSMRPKPETEPWKQTSLPVETQPKFEVLSKQTSAPESAHSTPVQQSKLAARFNPALAGILARGPPSASPVHSPARSESPVHSSAKMSGSTEPSADGAPLQDMRKGRARGPKKRNQGGGLPQSPVAEAEPVRQSFPETDFAAPKPAATKPRALPGSAASIMVSALGNRGQSTFGTEQPQTVAATSKTSRADPVDIPEFSGFGAARNPQVSSTGNTDDDKENTNNSGISTKAAEASASFWNRHRGPAATGLSQPSSAAAARSQSPARFSFDKNDDNDIGSFTPTGSMVPSSPGGGGGMPPKPARSSRVVSGQLREGSPNK